MWEDVVFRWIWIWISIWISISTSGDDDDDDDRENHDENRDGTTRLRKTHRVVVSSLRRSSFRRKEVVCFSSVFYLD